ASMALRIYRVFGSETIRRIRENPYALAREVHGIGFLLADRIANSIGIRGDFLLRVQAGVLHVLRESAEHGHCFVLLSSLRKNASLMLGVEEERVEIAVEKLAVQGDLVLQENTAQEAKRVYIAELYHAEKRVATAIQRLLSTSSFLHGERIANPKDKGRAFSRGALDFRRLDRHEDNPLQVDVVIVDEASMVDVTLMDHLLSAIDPHSHLILVGDVDQLPSVGPGSVLKDLIDSGAVPVAVLRRIFRQDQQS